MIQGYDLKTSSARHVELKFIAYLDLRLPTLHVMKIIAFQSEKYSEIGKEINIHKHTHTNTYIHIIL